MLNNAIMYFDLFFTSVALLCVLFHQQMMIF